MDTVCHYARGHLALHKDQLASCVHRSRDFDFPNTSPNAEFYSKVAVTIFIAFLIPSMKIGQNPHKTSVFFVVRPIHRITGLVLGICLAVFLNRANLLCLLDMRCSYGGYKGWIFHLLPVMRYIGFLPVFGLGAADLFVGLKYWIDCGGATTFVGLKNTMRYLSLVSAFTGCFLINQYTFPDWREFLDPTPQLVLKCLVCIITFPHLTWYLVGAAREWWTGKDKPVVGGQGNKNDNDLEAKPVKS